MTPRDADTLLRMWATGEVCESCLKPPVSDEERKKDTDYESEECCWSGFGCDDEPEVSLKTLVLLALVNKK